MKTFPENWVVSVNTWYNKGRTNMEHPVIKYLNKVYNKKHDGSCRYYGVRGNETIMFSFNEDVPSYITILTLEQFNEIVSPQQSMLQQTTKYLVPINMFEDRLKKGTILSLNESNVYVVHSPNTPFENKLILPKEIVETWKVAENEKAKVGDYIYITRKGVSNTSKNYSNRVFKVIKSHTHERHVLTDAPDCGGVYHNEYRIATPNEVQKMYTTLPEILGYKPTPSVDDIRYGCRIISKTSFKKLHEVMVHFGITSFEIKEGKVQYDQIEQINKFINI